MDEVRELIEQAVRHVRSRPEDLALTMRRVQRRRRGRRAIAALLALAIGAGGTWVAWRTIAAPARRLPAAPDEGRIALSTQRPDDLQPVIAVMDADGSNLRRLVPGDDPVWSPDGARIAFSRTSDDGSTGIWVVNADGSGERRLTANPQGADEEPSWSPDGRTIVFARSTFVTTSPDPIATEDRRDLYTVPAEGGEPSLLLGGPTDDSSPAWSPDGSTIAFARMTRGAPQLWLIRVDGTEPHRLTSFPPGAWSPSWSPDGSMLAFDDAGSHIYLIAADGSGLRTLDLPPDKISFPATPTWSPDGSHIAFSAEDASGPGVFVVGLDGADPRRLTDPQLGAGAHSWVGTGPGPTPVAAPTGSSCFASSSRGDFDDDGAIDLATLHILVPLATCGPEAVQTTWRAELTVSLATATFSVPFEDCEEPFVCRALEGSDVDGDLRAELPIVLGPGAAVSTVGMYRVEPGAVRALELAPPGDPGYLEPGPLRLGGPSDAIWQTGFECRVLDARRRELVAWSAQRDDAVSPWRLHLTRLELRDDVFVVTAIEDREGVTDLPPVWGTCP